MSNLNSLQNWNTLIETEKKQITGGKDELGFSYQYYWTSLDGSASCFVQDSRVYDFCRVQ